jgi:glycosyltransferase involved in cell wall biosynthesis
MKIWLYTVTHNEAKILPFFLRHYGQFCDRITVFDDKSTDGTQEIVLGREEARQEAARENEATGEAPAGRNACRYVLEPYPFSSGLDDRDFIRLATEAYKAARGNADWVIWVDPDEFLYMDAGPEGSPFDQLRATLEQFLKDGIQVPLTRGFQMMSNSFPDASSGAQIWELVTEGIEDPVYAKPCIFRPECEMQWEPGKHYVHGHFKRSYSPRLKVLHYRCLGLNYLRERHARNFARCSQANLASGLGVGVYPEHQGHMSEPWFKAVLPMRYPVTGGCSTFWELVRVIHGQDPYQGFKTQGHPEYQPSWGSEHPWLHETIERVQPQVLIEVGSFLGRSAAHMAKKLKEMGLDSALICVDTWLGDDEHWTIPEVRKLLRMHDGRPGFYYHFLGNMQLEGVARKVIPLPIDSISGARLLARLGIRADMIYIDGGHVEGEVYRDLRNYWTLLRPGGAMLADDYGDARFPGLQRDVDRFIRETGARAEFNEHKARIWAPA